MCFSPAADFTAAAVLAPMGVLTLRAARNRNELVVASIPMIFAVHQFVEAFVWLGAKGEVSHDTQKVAIYIYLGIAQVLLPIVVPLAVLLVEPSAKRRKFMWFAFAVGVALGLQYAGILIRHHTGAYPLAHTMVYKTSVQPPWFAGLGYAIAVGFTTLASSHRYLVYFGILNIIGISVAGAVRYEAVTSIWCVYAAFISVLIYLFLKLPRTPSGPGDPGFWHRGAPAEPAVAV